MSRSKVAVLTAAVAFAVWPPPTLAGIADSPLPVLLAGETTFHLYSVPGIIGNSHGLSTYFSCTSTDTSAIQVGVEVFDNFGNLANLDVTENLTRAID